MSNANRKTAKDSIYLYILISFVVGFISGAGFAVYKMGPLSSPAKQSQGQAAAMTEQQNHAITTLEAEVTAHPDRFESWTRLGNLYFDSGQYTKAIKAYTKSLELHAGNADIWTDLGVMYRRTKQPEKAIESFDKAISMNPQHEISRMNKGIVLMYDLGDTEGAIQAWEELLRVNPEAQAGNGESIRQFVDQVKADLARQ